MRRPLFPLLAAALLAVPALAQDPSQPVPTVEEPRSEVEFPRWMDFPGGKQPLHLLAVGLRTKTIFAVKVYAFGLYLDARAAAAALRDYRGLRPKDRRKSRAFYRALLNGDFSKGLRWVMTRDVDGEDIAEAFAESLEPRLEKLARSAKPEVVAADRAALARFKTFFSDELEEGTELVFAWHPGGRLVTRIGGKVMGEVKSHNLALALFDVYLGSDPISEDAKEAFADALPGFLDLAAGLPPLPAAEEAADAGADG